MQEDRSMRIEDAFGTAGCARGVAHCRGIALIDPRLDVARRIGGCQDFFIVHVSTRERAQPLAAGARTWIRASDHQYVLNPYLRSEHLEERYQTFVEDQDPIARVVDDVGELLVMEP